MKLYFQSSNVHNLSEVLAPSDIFDLYRTLRKNEHNLFLRFRVVHVCIAKLAALIEADSSVADEAHLLIVMLQGQSAIVEVYHKLKLLYVSSFDLVPSIYQNYL